MNVDDLVTRLKNLGMTVDTIGNETSALVSEIKVLRDNLTHNFVLPDEVEAALVAVETRATGIAAAAQMPPDQAPAPAPAPVEPPAQPPIEPPAPPSPAPADPPAEPPAEAPAAAPAPAEAPAQAPADGSAPVDGSASNTVTESGATTADQAAG